MLNFGDVVKVVHKGFPFWNSIILQRESKFNESSLTGKLKFVLKAFGDPVYSGTVNKSSPFLIRTISISGKLMLNQIIKAVRKGQACYALIKRVADTFTSHFVFIVICIVIATFGISKVLPEKYLNVAISGWPFWSLQFAIAVFIIACFCGIGFAALTAFFVGGGLAAKQRIFVKSGKKS
ncbi:hypothetical protein GGTG_11855, partial [Gaeumannomyces tritici R3-111a-1]